MTYQTVERGGVVKGVLAAAVLALSLGTAAEGKEIVDFKQVTSDLPKIQLLSTGALVAAPTAAGALEGLSIGTTMVTTNLGGTAVSHYNGSLNPGLDGLAGTADDSTDFDHVTLELKNLTATGSATSAPVPPFTLLSQAITAGGTFTLWSDHKDGAIPVLPPTDPGYHADQFDLLQGTVTSMYVIGLQGTGSAWIQANVQYTGGELLAPWKAANGYQPGDIVTGELSWSLSSTVPTIGINIPTGQLRPFTADMTGLVSAPTVPEPASLALLALSGFGLLGRFRKHKARVQ